MNDLIAALKKERAPNTNAPKRITGLDFEFLGPSEIRKMSSAIITKCDFYETTSNKPASGGVLDLRLGTTDSNYACQTCGQNPDKCPGHFGSIELLFPIYNTGYYPHIIHILKCICKTCSHILLPKEDIDKRLKRLFNHPAGTVNVRIEQLKKLIKECEKEKICPHCGAVNGQIRKGKSLLLIGHQIGQSSEDLRDTFTKKFRNLVVTEFEQASNAEHVYEDLTPVRVLHLFDHIPKRELPLLMGGFKVANPSDMIVRTLIVPPNCIRPSVIAAGEGSTEDDLTIRLREAIDNTMQLQKSMEAGHTAAVVMEKWNMMQQILNSFINSEGPDTIMKKKGKKDKPVIGVSQRLKGKHGRFRTNLGGKRVNFSGRTVISPDPNAAVDQVVVPLEMAMILTFPERVTKHNREKLKRCVINGPSVYPGANRLLNVKSGIKRDLRYGNREELANALEYGDVVDRHLMADDVILFNRQPSLHRISIMAFRAKIMPWRTMRFNECACAPFNADFDGDEMNIHLPQTVEAAADAKVLMNVLNNLFSPRCGELIVAPTQDFLSGSYLLTRKNSFLDYSHFTFLLAQIFDADEPVDIPPPAIVYPVPLWTGKQLISLMIKPSSRYDTDFTHSIPNKEYSGKKRHMCHRDGYVSFLHSEMISGVLEKSLIGGGSKSLFAVLARDFSPKFSAVCMGRIAKLACRYIMNRGFSIGITDVTPSDQMKDDRTRVISQAYKDAEDIIEQYTNKSLAIEPGMNLDQTYEMKMNTTLSKVREDMGKLCINTLSPLNTALVMANSGAKGSAINISQMMTCVGQQIISGQRVLEDFIDRTIPHFHHKCLEPAAKGFVANSFFSGLEPYEFFFHTMGGREGLVDAAVKTAETGYLQRRLVKSLEDAVVQYDGTVRVADGSVLQFKYGDDGLDPLVLEDKNFPIDLNRVSYKLLMKFNECDLITPEDAKARLLQHLEKHMKPEKDVKPFEIPVFLVKKFEDFVVKNVISQYEKLIHDLCDRVINDKAAEIMLTEQEEFLYHTIMADEPQHVINEKAICAFRTELRNMMPITAEYIDEFYRFTKYRLERALIDPGTTVGAIAAQSIGEPATQMTLKSFHFAGVASMNVSMGVPRIQEVMNALNKIKTPVIAAKFDTTLINDEEEYAVRQVKGRIDRITLGQVTKRITQIEDDKGCIIEVILNAELIHEAGMEIDNRTVREAIIREKKTGIVKENVTLMDGGVQINFRGMDPDSLSFVMQQLMLKLPSVQVTGLPGVTRVLIPKDEKTKKFRMYVEGNALLDVMTTLGVDGCRTISNHVLEVEKVLGIEAARSVIISEISEVYKNYGLGIDRRHLMLLADAMTSKGKVYAMNRHGLAKTATSSLKLASFEVTMEHLFNAGYHQIEDATNGSSSSVILGAYSQVGSGMMDMLIADELISKPVLTPKMPFLTPQAPNRLRDEIASGQYDPRNSL